MTGFAEAVAAAGRVHTSPLIAQPLPSEPPPPRSRSDQLNLFEHIALLHDLGWWDPDNVSTALFYERLESYNAAQETA